MNLDSLTEQSGEWLRAAGPDLRCRAGGAQQRRGGGRDKAELE